MSPDRVVMVVDDNVINLKVLRLLLEAEGFEPVCAGDAEEARATLQKIRPWLILMDIQLPGMDGLELTRRLKADAATRDIVIVAVTSYAMKGDEERMLAAGCDAYVAKPIDIHDLPKLIRRLEARPPAALAPPREDT
jgi:two-component system, cell cycle response regulator DivK